MDGLLDDVRDIDPSNRLKTRSDISGHGLESLLPPLLFRTTTVHWLFESYWVSPRHHSTPERSTCFLCFTLEEKLLLVFLSCTVSKSPALI